MKNYFDEDFIKYFKGLSNHNDREWFEKNKSLYLEKVKEPFYKFVEEMILRLHLEDERINLEAKEAVFRIYRDVRFSKDKTPYKPYASALISAHGRKDLEFPGYYFELSHKEVGVFGGAYSIEKDHLKNLRRFIAHNQNEFTKLINEKKFKSYFGELKGEKAKRLDKEFNEALARQPLIANKQFYYGAQLPHEIILSHKLPDELMKYFKAGMKMNLFLEEGLKG